MKRGMVVGFLVVAMVFGVFAYAYAVDSSQIKVTAVVNPRIELTLSKTAVSLELLDPLTGNETDSDSVVLNVRSNVPYTVTAKDAGGDDLSTLGFSMDDIDGTYAKAPSATGFDHTVNFNVDVSGSDWPNPTVAALTHDYYYTVLQ